jgi:membrane protease YdiL (CAAX protease family)
MFAFKPKTSEIRRPLIEAFSASFGMWLFALFIHSGLPLVMLTGAGLIATAATLTQSLHAEDWSLDILGFGTFVRGAAPYLLSGCVIGAVFGLIYRVFSDMGALPTRMGGFIIFAASIGAAEEILFRGYVQNRLRCLTPAVAIVLASVAHTIYKSALFVLPPDSIDIGFSYKSFVVLTFFGGAVFGSLRELSGSVLPPLIGHVLFDIIVYGQNSAAPWWVWS